MRILWLTFGVICVALGAIGVILPLLPTVPFMLLAAFCFARSSERLHHWLVMHPQFGPAIQNWQEYGAVSRRAKRLATVSVLLVWGLTIVLGAPGYVIAIQAVVLSAVMLFLWTRPD
ncbi:Inner membrane protein YbaN [Roseovarius albus]|uniref:Inner membrane protein YbaN n=1 Tax=Roseovarius albus TaxID=1247867 RepID=A0A1X6YG72_9RHOB|nr:YbaN family protein [Roseovarius albus]SLN19715.1 Inner membrane protein YbaN [Roseovarius albus]